MLGARNDVLDDIGSATHASQEQGNVFLLLVKRMGKFPREMCQRRRLGLVL